MEVAKANSYDDLVKVFEKKHFTRGILKARKSSERLADEILNNENLQNFMLHYLAERIYNEARK